MLNSLSARGREYNCLRERPGEERRGKEILPPSSHSCSTNILLLSASSTVRGKKKCSLDSYLLYSAPDVNSSPSSLPAVLSVLSKLYAICELHLNGLFLSFPAGLIKRCHWRRPVQIFEKTVTRDIFSLQSAWKRHSIWILSPCDCLSCLMCLHGHAFVPQMEPRSAKYVWRRLPCLVRLCVS